MMIAALLILLWWVGPRRAWACIRYIFTPGRL